MNEICYSSDVCSQHQPHSIVPQAANTAHHEQSHKRNYLFLVFLLTLVFQPVPVEAVDAQCTDSRCLSEHALQTQLVFLGTQGQSCCCKPAGVPDLTKCVKSPDSLWTTFPGGKGGSAQYIEELCPLCKPCFSSLHPLGSCPNSALITES